MASGPQTTRVPVTAPATLSHTFVVGEIPTDPSPATATVVITDATGATIVPSTAANHGTAGVFTYSLPGQADLTDLTVAWSAVFSGSTVIETDYAAIVGRRYFTLADARGSDTSLASPERYSLADLERGRLEVEDEVETICDRAFVPRYRRAVLDGTGGTEIMLTDAPWAELGRSAGDIRRIASATQASQYGGTATALTPTQLAACYVTAANTLRRTDGNVWVKGYGNIVIEYEYGWSTPPSDLVHAMYTRLRDVLNREKTGVPDRATSYTVPDGGTYRIAQPEQYKTGIPSVDAAYARYSRRAGQNGSNGSSPAVGSRPLTYQVQRYSLFHGRSY